MTAAERDLIQQQSRLIADLTAERERLRKALDLLIDFIPEGWEVPLGYSQVVAKARELGRHS